MTESKIRSTPDDQPDRAADGHPDLRAIREEKGLSLRDIFEQTRISVAYMDAIEKRHYHLLPEPVYTRTFIKNYARAIGVDSTILLGSYEQYLQALQDRLRQEQEAGGAREKAQTRHRWVAGILSALFAAVILVIILTYYNRPGQEDVPGPSAPSVEQSDQAKPAETPPSITPAPPEAPPVEEKIAPAQTMPAAQPSREASPATVPPVDGKPVERIPPDKPRPETEKNYRLLLEAREQVWLRIRQDRNRPEQMILEAGDTRERFAAETFTLDIGNAGGVDITFQDRPVGPIGKRGQVVHLRFP
jgi:cytoskeletal protein RodZ